MERTRCFQDSPLKDPFTFIDLTDPQCSVISECRLSAETIRLAFETSRNAGFLAINGDMVDNGADEQQWRWLLGLSEGNLMRTTLLPVAGNHDKQENAFIEHFNVRPPPGSPTSSGAYYSMDYGNAHFIVLNTNETSREYGNFSPAQAKWFERDAAEAKTRGAEWIIALLHEGPYTTGKHAMKADIAGPKGSRRKIAPLLAKAGVDLVLQGHDHIYGRSRPIRGDGSPVNAAKTVGVLDGLEIDYTVDPGAPIYLLPGAA